MDLRGKGDVPYWAAFKDVRRRLQTGLMTATERAGKQALNYYPYEESHTPDPHGKVLQVKEEVLGSNLYFLHLLMMELKISWLNQKLAWEAHIDGGSGKRALNSNWLLEIS